MSPVAFAQSCSKGGASLPHKDQQGPCASKVGGEGILSPCNTSISEGPLGLAPLAYCTAPDLWHSAEHPPASAMGWWIVLGATYQWQLVLIAKNATKMQLMNGFQHMSPRWYPVRSACG